MSSSSKMFNPPSWLTISENPSRSSGSASPSASLIVPTPVINPSSSLKRVKLPRLEAAGVTPGVRSMTPPRPKLTSPPTSPAHAAISSFSSSSIPTKARATPSGDGSCSNRAERVSETANKRGRRSSSTSSGFGCTETADVAERRRDGGCRSVAEMGDVMEERGALSDSVDVEVDMDCLRRRRREGLLPRRAVDTGEVDRDMSGRGGTGGISSAIAAAAFRTV